MVSEGAAGWSWENSPEKVVWGQRGLCVAVSEMSVLFSALLNKLLISDGLGYCFCLDFPESVGSRLDRVLPFTLLKRVPGLKYIPGSLAERRASGNSM